jgi:antirestriction protein ArdC
MGNQVDVYEIVTERMLALLEAGTVPWRKPWNAGNAPRNIEGNVYRGINVFLLGMSSYASPFWLTFNQARERGGSVRKGEKSTLIVFWKRLRVETEKGSGEYKVIPLLRYYRVFNLEQTDGVKLPAKVADFKPVEHEANVSAEEVIVGYVNGPSIDETGVDASYAPLADHISVPPRGSFANINDFYATLFHEIGHSTGHKSRLNRTMNTNFGGHEYGREELVAEMTAAFLGAEAAIEVPENNHAAYLASWIQTIKADPRAVVVAAGAAQRAADHILGREFAKEEKEAA